VTSRLGTGNLMTFFHSVGKNQLYGPYHYTNYFFFRLAEPVIFKDVACERKAFTIKEGEVLPATFKFKKDRFIFVVDRDLTVSMNGTK
jgi:hypothetical protein